MSCSLSQPIRLHSDTEMLCIVISGASSSIRAPGQPPHVNPPTALWARGVTAWWSRGKRADGDRDKDWQCSVCSSSCFTIEGGGDNGTALTPPSCCREVSLLSESSYCLKSCCTLTLTKTNLNCGSESTFSEGEDAAHATENSDLTL